MASHWPNVLAPLITRSHGNRQPHAPDAAGAYRPTTHHHRCPQTPEGLNLAEIHKNIVQQYDIAIEALLDQLEA
jgi:hypothetical protein